MTKGFCYMIKVLNLKVDYSGRSSLIRKRVRKNYRLDRNRSIENTLPPVTGCDYIICVLTCLSTARQTFCQHCGNTCEDGLENTNI
jgi:hypothetical protein